MKYVFVAVLLLACAYSANAQNSTCEVCIDVAQTVEFVVNVLGYTNATQIEMVLQALCAQLGSLQTECDAILLLYLDKIIVDVVSGASPQKVCSDIGLCSARKHTPPTPSHSLKYKKLVKIQ